MLGDRVMAEMIFYATTNDYSDADRYERFALDCKLDEKAVEIGKIVRYLSGYIPRFGAPLKILETASATGLTAVGVTSELARAGIKHGYTSLDIEQNLLLYAKLRQRGNSFVRGDFENLPFEQSAFDIYIMMGAEGYRPNGGFYPEAYRVLKSGGYYVMPQIGPQPIVRIAEKEDVLRSGFIVIRADNYLIARKSYT
ncbi:MAG: hypothetical protein A3H69_02600 [Candidatus Sungbacteria bacterium RIFCSPLOWO2_02_FULL_47_9]|nr:MAG: Methylase involved in ubiquinone/menaquinone biosynthesis [Parcubacteria group bacterium GW2011_GWA2_47_10]OHA05427.1 MAG: hypothetical protein A3A28_02935 [Candidatus Sungbacteria bacterium RIFCSPLOWO2_01_FULL_47_32]OHA09351.1 MAG: hypothetical protein A3H69_02600 [Candidatus Sungbacteria bacterium RIFCSPLOWO2_02_FULL_47_9]